VGGRPPELGVGLGLLGKEYVEAGRWRGEGSAVWSLESGARFSFWKGREGVACIQTSAIDIAYTHHFRPFIIVDKNLLLVWPRPKGDTCTDMSLGASTLLLSREFPGSPGNKPLEVRLV